MRRAGRRRQQTTLITPPWTDHLDALGGSAPVDGAEPALPKLVAVVEVVGRLQELLEAVDLPWILHAAPVLGRPRRIRSSISSDPGRRDEPQEKKRFISSTYRQIRDSTYSRVHDAYYQGRS